MHSVVASRWVFVVVYTVVVGLAFSIGVLVRSSTRWTVQDPSLQPIVYDSTLMLWMGQIQNHTPGMQWRDCGQIADSHRDESRKLQDPPTKAGVILSGPYYEALVQPALFVHKEPKAVAIFGERGSLAVQEVLKHRTVDSVILIAITDAVETMLFCQLCNTTGESFKFSTLCIDDPRIKIRSGVESFIDKYSESDKLAEEMLFDVIVLDLDISNSANTVLASDAFHKSLHNALDTQGVLVANSGRQTHLRKSPHAQTGANAALQWKERIVQAGFDSLQEYEESTIGYFVVAFKRFDTKFRWFSNEAETNLDIVKRSIPTQEGGIPLCYFDGAKMETYRYPSKTVEIEYCRQRPGSYGCGEGSAFVPGRQNVLPTSFIVKPSMIENAGRGVFATDRIAKWSYIALDDCVHRIHFPESAADLIYLFVENDYDDFPNYWEMFEVYIDGYGFPSNLFGNRATDVDPGILTFVNHGCNATYNVGDFDLINEQTARSRVWPDERMPRSYSPPASRSSRTYFCAAEISLRDIQTGEELLTNYMTFCPNPLERWDDELRHLKMQCAYGLIGEVVEYELSTKFGKHFEHINKIW